MLGQNFYNGLTRKYVTFFGSLFSDISIDRVDASGSVQQTMKIPLDYGPKERYLTRQIQNPDLLREVSMVLPRMAFEITGFYYDTERKLSTIDTLSSTYSGSTMSTVYNPVPWNIDFTLSIICRNTEDATRIIEQILPFFTPNWNQELNLISSIGKNYSIPVVLKNVQPTDTYSGNFENKEFVLWDLVFTMKAWFFGPVTRQGVITDATINLRIPPDGVDISNAIGTATISQTFEVQPGLTANGLPTSNASQSIPASQITANSNYGFITTFTENLPTQTNPYPDLPGEADFGNAMEPDLPLFT